MDSFLAIHGDNSASLFMYKKELGQGITTGTLQIVAEELDMELSQLSTVRIDTNRFANQGSTVASGGISTAGRQIRRPPAMPVARCSGLPPLSSGCRLPA